MECESTESVSLLSLPSLALLHIGAYLGARDLLNLSATCRHLRTAFNVNSLWRRYSDGGDTGRALEVVPCLVRPEFAVPTGSRLDPLCSNRVHMLRESHLVDNLRRGRFVEHTYDFKHSINNRWINDCYSKYTFNSIYLFVMGENKTNRSFVVNVLNIESEPYLVTSVPVRYEELTDVDDYGIHVINNKLVVLSPTMCMDIYEIKLPDPSCSHITSVKLRDPAAMRVTENDPQFYSHFIFVPQEEEPSIHVWDLDNGKKVGEIFADVVHLTILNHRVTSRHILLSGYVYLSPDDCQRRVFGYDTEALAFTSFSVARACESAYREEVTTDGRYVVFVSKRRISVYNYETSSFVVECSLTYPDYYSRYSFSIMGNLLMAPSRTKVRVLNIDTLETIWEIPVFARDTVGRTELTCRNMQNRCKMIVIQSSNGTEIWDLVTKRQLFSLHSRKHDPFYNLYIRMYTTCGSKMVFVEVGDVVIPDRLVVLNFW